MGKGDSIRNERIKELKKIAEIDSIYMDSMNSEEWKKRLDQGETISVPNSDIIIFYKYAKPVD